VSIAASIGWKNASLEPLSSRSGSGESPATEAHVQCTDDRDALGEEIVEHHAEHRAEAHQHRLRADEKAQAESEQDEIRHDDPRRTP
jgi:hypothetical protein